MHAESRAAAPQPRRGPANQILPSRSRAPIVPALSSGLAGYLKACAPGQSCLVFRRGSAERSGHGQPPRALHRRQDAHRGAGHLEGKCPGVGVGASHGSSRARRGLGREGSAVTQRGPRRGRLASKEPYLGWRGPGGTGWGTGRWPAVPGAWVGDCCCRRLAGGIPRPRLDSDPGWKITEMGFLSLAALARGAGIARQRGRKGCEGAERRRLASEPHLWHLLFCLSPK